MKCFVVFVLFLSSFNALEIDRVEVANGPRVDISTIIISWKTDKSDTGKVLGYKIKIWEKPRVRKMVFKSTEDGLFQPVIELQDPPISLHKLPEGDPDVIRAKANETSITYDGVRTNVHYEIRVLSFDENGDGPISAPLGIKIGSKEEVVEK